MITDHNIALNFIKKENLTGSYKGLRYMFVKEEENLAVTIWPEPYCFEKTDEDKKTKKLFDFSEEGKKEAIDWMNEQYESRISEWQNTPNY